jgi:hypothetical protein
MRIRTLKPYVWEDEKLGSVSREARLLFIGLITLADDEGRFRAAVPVIVGHVYPYDRDAARRVPRWMRELVNANLIELYSEGAYGYLPGWAKHQRITHPSPSLIPEPLTNHSGAIHE